MLVVHDLLEQRGADPLRHPAAHLSVDDQRIDDPPAVLDHDVAVHADLERFGVHLHHSHVRGARRGAEERIVETGHFQPRLHVRGQAAQAGVGGLGYVCERQAAARVGAHENTAVLQAQVVRIGFHDMARNPECFVFERLPGANGRAAGQHRATAGIRARPLRSDSRVATNDAYRVQADAQRVGHDLRQCGLVSLALRGDAERRGYGPSGVHAHEGGLGAGCNRHARRDGNGGTDAGQLDVRGVAEPHPSALGARPGKPVAGRIHVQDRPCFLHAFGQTGLIPDQAGRRLVRKVAGPNVISEPEFGRVHVKPARGPIHQAFQYERGDRAAHAAVGTHRRLARRHAAVARSVVRHAVRPGQKADRLDRLDRGRPRVDRVSADVRDDVRTQAGNRPIAVKRELGIDDLVPCLCRGQQVFAPVADPLDGPFK